MTWFANISKQLGRIIVLLEQLVRLFRLRKPGMVDLRIFQTEGPMKFIIVLPPRGAADVIKRELSYKIGDADIVKVELEGGVLESETLTCDDNATVTGQLVDIDDATPPNPSPAREFSFVVTDTIAPPQPGELGINVVSDE